MKSQRWFPVWINPVPDAVRFDAYIMARDYRQRVEPQMHFVGQFLPEAQGRGLALCRQGDDSFSGQPFLRCEVTRANGTNIIQDVRFEVLSNNDLLILVISDTQDEFDFLGSIERRNRGIIRVIDGFPDDWLRQWQVLDGIDIVILDKPETSLASAQLKTLQQWVVSGGTLFLTGRSLISAAGHTPSAVFPEVVCSGEKRDIDPRLINPLLGKYRESVVSLQCFSIQAAPACRLITAGPETLVAGKDVVCGRVIALGVDWQNVVLRDRAVFELVRKTFWNRWLELWRSRQLRDLSREHVLPREVKVRFLAVPLALFLLAYVILLGPVNWFVLRRRKKLEWSVLSLFAGALVFSILAFVVGVCLRTSEPILYEAQVVIADHGAIGLVRGITGLLSPDRRIYQLSMDDPMAMLNEARHYTYPIRKPGLRTMLVHAFEKGPTISNIHITTWAMRFFTWQSVVDLNGGMTAQATCDRTTLHGTVTNHFPFVLKDATVLYRWDRVRLGDVQPGQSLSFDLRLTPPAKRKIMRCPNCHGYHKTPDWFSEEYCEQNPLTPELREFLSHGYPYAGTDQPEIVGWQELSANSAHIHEPVYQSKSHRLHSVPVNLCFEGNDILIPEGIVSAVSVQVSSGQRDRSEESPFRIESLAQLPYRLEVIDPQAFEDQEKEPQRSPVHFMDLESEKLSQKVRQFDFYLPFIAEQVDTSLLRVHWCLEKADPEEPVSAAILSVYNWERQEWEEIIRASEGEHVKNLSNPGAFIHLPYPVVQIKVEPVDPGVELLAEEKYLEIAYEGQRVKQ